MSQILAGIVRGADGADGELAEDLPGGEFTFGKGFRTAIPDGFGGLLVEKIVDVEVALQFEMGAVIERITDGEGNGAGPGYEFFAWGGVASAEFLGDAVGAHGSPFV